MTEAVAVVALSLACAGWALLQRWVARRDPANPGVVRDCSGCACGDGRSCRD